MPKNGAEIRDISTDHIRKMSLIKWQTSTKIDFTESTDWTGALLYEPGVQYVGTPYVSNRLDGDSDLYEFSDALTDGYYTGPKTWQTMFGSDCGGAIRLTYAYSGALINCSPGTEFSFDPTYANLEKQGLTTVGGYDCSRYPDDRSATTYDSIMALNGRDKMYECYAAVRNGDCLWSYWGTGEHIRYCFQDAKVVYEDGKTIDGSQSYIRILEQTSSVFRKNSGTQSTWRQINFSFEELFNDGYIPLTMLQFDATHIEYPDFSLDGVAISGKVNANALLSGIVNCNYNIFKLCAEITDQSGKTVSTGIAYPYVINADLSRLNYSVKPTEIPAGKYHYRLTAEIGYGTKVLVDEDIDYSGSEEIVVFIADDGNGNGSSPDNPLGNAEGYGNISQTSYKKSALSRAVEMVKHCGGTIVVCGKVTILSGHYFTDVSLTDFTIPAVPSTDDVTVKITSVYGGADYRKNGACITFRKTVGINPLLEIRINTEWDNIDLVSDIEYGADRTMIISCCNKKTVFGRGFNYRIISDGFELDPKTSWSLLPSLAGGYRYAVEPGNTDVTVLGGNWKDIAAGPYGAESVHHGILRGNTKLSVGGDAVIYGDILGCSHDKTGKVSGDALIIISGGTVRGDIILSGNGGFDDNDSSASLNASGRPVLLGTVRVIGDGAKNKLPAKTILNFTDAWSTAVLPDYTASDFTEVREQVIDLSRETEETDKDSVHSETEHGGRIRGIDGNIITVVIIAAALIIAVIVVTVIIKTDKKTKTENKKGENQ
ncbi:MAG: hypothetical protein IKS28_03595 [Clostridia bacterium]|nr:hypothetical protein [Clostridia bacterium]